MNAVTFTNHLPVLYDTHYILTYQTLIFSIVKKSPGMHYCAHIKLSTKSKKMRDSDMANHIHA